MHRKRGMRVVAAVATVAALAAGGASFAALASGAAPKNGLSTKAAGLQIAQRHIAQAVSHRLDVSNRGAVDRYLRSRGYNPKKFVFQRGRQNYAGPRCPGRHWNCTRSRRVVQFGTDNKTECIGPGASQPAPGACVIVQGTPTSPSTGNNQAVCNEQSQSPTAVESCDISQVSTSGRNTAVAHQKVESNEHGSVQNAAQQVHISQTSVAGDNVALWDQRIQLKAEDNKGDTNQTQDAHHDARISQTSMSGNSMSVGTQEHHLSAKTHGDTTDQEQNQGTSPYGDCHPDNSTPAAALITDPNACAMIEQTSATGNLSSNLDQTSDLDADAKASDITQTQGHHNGGIDHGIDQLTSPTALAKAVGNQTEDFDANAKPKTGLGQFQHGPVGVNSPSAISQCCNPADTAEFHQVSTLHASPGPSLFFTLFAAPIFGAFEQDTHAGIFFDTSGNAHGVQDLTTDEQSVHNETSGPVIYMQADCASGGESGGGDAATQQASEPCPATTTPPETTSTETIY